MTYDLIIRKGVVVDGSGSPPFRADIGISEDKIKSIGDLSGESAEVVLDAAGMVVSPGFIDIHNHSDLTIFEVPSADNYILQGVTTLVIGNCGSSPAPLTDVNFEEEVKRVKREHPDIEVKWRSFSEYVKALDEVRPAVNIVPLVGHGTIRAAVLGFGPERPSEKDIHVMKELTRESMEAGAFGVSTGLIYIPGTFSTTEEIIELAKVAASWGGIYTTHMRNEGVGLLDSIYETVTIGLKAGIGVEISHLKASGRPSWGKVVAALKIIEDYAARGYDVSADAYPYPAASTSLATLLPREIRGASSEEIMKKLRDPDTVRNLKDRLGGAIFEERYISWTDIMISYSPGHREYEGMRLDKIAESLGVDPVEAVVRILLDDELATGMVTFSMREEDVRTVISHPLVAIGSDGSVGRFGVGKPHPRRYGTFPRVIAKYVREEKVLTLQEAVRKMTSLPARKLRLWNRGLIRPGFKADLVVFNYHSIEDTATYENPHSYPRGIRYVIVNGKVSVEAGKVAPTVRAGKVLRRGMPD